MDLTHKLQQMTIFFFSFQRKQVLTFHMNHLLVDVHMKYQDLFSLKKKKIKCRLLQILIGALRVKKSHYKTCLFKYIENFTTQN